MLQNHTNEEKGKEKKIEKGRARRRKGGEEKKAMIATLVFIISTLEITLSKIWLDIYDIK